MRRTLWFVLIILALLPGTVLAQETGNIAVTGHVTNGTPGGTLPVGEPVTLQFYNEGAWTAIYTTTLAADGTFRFTDFSPEGSSDFVTHILYQGVDYYSSPTKLADEGDLVTDLSIFEPTTDASSVVVDQVHYFVVPQGESVRIAEYYLVGNTSDRTYVGVENAAGIRTTLTFTPLVGATNLSFDGPGLGERYVGDIIRFDDTRAIPPGNATVDVDFSYEIPFTDGMHIERVVDTPIALAALIISSENVGIEGPGIEPQGMINTQMGVAASYSAGPLAAGEPLAFTFVPQTMTIATVETTPRAKPLSAAQQVGIGVVALALAGGVGYWLLRPSSVPPPPEAARPLLVAIATLDARFAGGDISEETYHRERDALKQQLYETLRENAGS
jgi:hypothetical protein